MVLTGYKHISLPLNVRQVISTSMAWKYAVVPLRDEGDTLFFLAEEGTDHVLVSNELHIITGKEVVLETVGKNVIAELLAKYYPRVSGNEGKINVKVGSDDFVIQLIKEAKLLRSSDIHIEPNDLNCRVRIRVDGALVERYSIPKTDFPAVLNRLKIMSRLDISEKRLPQDGRILFKQGGFQFDIRVSVLPTLYGEKVVLRILSNDASGLDLGQLGFSHYDLCSFQESIKKPHGIILISGPTGSGKTTTLYATLKVLNTTAKNILTIEDPIEYTLDGINQVQLKEDIGLDFSKALKTFLRQDPDIIMVGEIRDVETAQMAMRASLTGHLVLSTIHTNSAWGIVSRLVDMGIPPFMVANTLNMAVAQRLLRLLCDDCKQHEPFDERILPAGYKPSVIPEVHYRAIGCENCLFTGYKGRKAIYEVLPIDAELKEKIKKGELSVDAYLKANGVKLIADQAYDMFIEGRTSIEEAYSFLFHE